MKAYILSSDVRISPFDDPPGEALVLNRRVRDRQTEILRKLGLQTEGINTIEEIQDTEYLLFRDYVYCSPALLKGFLKAVRKHGESRRLALETNAQIEMAFPMQDLDTLPAQQEGGPEVYAFDLFYVNQGEKSQEEVLRSLPPEVVPIKMKVVEVDPPFYVREETKNRIGMSKFYCYHLKHWLHIYLLNFAALIGLPFEWFPRKLFWFLWRLLTAFSSNKFKIMQRLVIKGKNCSIHPTAVVEASVLGNGVTLGHNALVRGSYIGDGVTIADGAQVVASVVGDGSEISWDTGLNLALLYPRACVGQPGLQSVFLGRETFVAAMAYGIDVKFQGGYVGVRHQGKTVTTRMTTLGPCFGHRVRIGAGVHVNCGREIPNDVAIVPDADPILSKIPDSGVVPGIYMNRKGELVPVLIPEKAPEGTDPTASVPSTD